MQCVVDCYEEEASFFYLKIRKITIIKSNKSEWKVLKVENQITDPFVTVSIFNATINPNY